MKSNLPAHLNFPFRFLLAVFLCTACPGLFSQNIQFERIPNELGLSQNLITALCQDQQGFIWVGTKDGLNRFDGYSFKVFQHDPFDSTTISDNNIKCLLEDRQGRLWVGTGNGLNLLDRATESFQRLYATGEIPSDAPAVIKNHPGLSSHDVQSLMEDREGQIWVGMAQGSLVRMRWQTAEAPPAQANFTVFLPTAEEASLWGKGIKSMAQDEAGTVWVHSEAKLCKINWDKQQENYRINRLDWEDFDPQWPGYQQTDFLNVDQRQEQLDQRFYTIFKDQSGAVWLVSAGGFAKWLPQRKTFQLFPLNVDSIDFNSPPLLSIDGAGGFIDPKGRIWVNGFGSLVVYDTLSRRMVARYHRRDKATPDFLKAGTRSLMADAIGNVWVGTNGNGLFKYTPRRKRFSGQVGAQLFDVGSVRAIHQSTDGAVWVGTTRPSLLRVDLETREAQAINLNFTDAYRDYNLPYHQLFAIEEDQAGNLWLGGTKGLLRVPLAVEERDEWAFFSIYKDFFFPNVLALHLGPEADEIWLLSHSEFGRFDPVTGKFHGQDFLDASGGKKIMGANLPCLFRQNENTFWIGTDKGLLKYEVDRNRFSFLTTDPQDERSLSHPVVKCIYPDPKQPERILWIGTGGGGLNRLDLQSGKFSYFKKKDGLPDDVVYGILDDEAGNLWISTNQGLSRFNPETGIFKNYTAKDGLQDNEFNSGAFFKSKDGMLFFGGIGGFNAFLPSAVKDNEYVPPIVITDFKLANQSVDITAEDSPLKTDISQTEELVLNWKHNIFSFEFASLDYTEPGKNQYAYRLEGFDDEWQYIGTQRSATFTNIDPGEYTFRVKGTNHDGTWNEEGTSLKITILPPWWKTWWAYLGYAILLGAAGYVFYKFQLNRRLEQAEAERLKEMDSLKTRLYTNITHEFRTPLTVIMGMTEKLALGSWQSAVSERDKSMLGHSFLLIQRNGKNLLRLVNQLLDLSKLDSGKMTLDLVQTDVVNYLQYLTESFHSIADDKNIQLTFYSEEPELTMDCDEAKLQHILYNLLSNGIKFTPSGGKIIVHLRQILQDGQPYLKVVVQDNGIGIPPNKLPHVFDRFYQVDSSTTRKGEGTGIGLALTKELVEIIGGSISVKSREGTGTDFTVLLPVCRSSVARQFDGSTVERNAPFEISGQNVANEKITLSADWQTDESGTDERNRLLIIEDNRDVTAYLVSILENDYQIETAEDGQAGIEKALETIPDIIISDVMMPRKDGFEVCRALKLDERTSHIPIVLLTAKADDKAKITGLKTGADAYLMKPFNREELFVRLEKLIELRNQLQKKYAQADPPDPQPSATEPTLDDLFMQKFKQAIEKKMELSDLGVDDLCEELSISRTQLFRKTKALTGESPVRLIQQMRLRKAKELLRTTELNVSEIAYEVGFTDPAYFSRAFNKEFGMSPSTIRK
ncbi:MAG: two-component regulator propeller domain-containing protein [Saprospiraceae bacterium]